MSDFILLFNGREGSSPLITQLSNHPQVLVPIFEQFDRRVLQPRLENNGMAIEDFISQILNRSLSETTKKIIKNAVGKEMVSRLEQCSTTDIIGFKWRPWGNPSVLKQKLIYPVKFLTIARINLLHLALSLLFSEKLREDRPELSEHPQFYAKSLSDDEYQKFFESLMNTRIRPSEHKVTHLMRHLIQQKQGLIRYMGEILGGKPLIVFYEEIFSSSGDGLRVVFEFLDLPPYAEEKQPSTSTFRKSGMSDPSVQVENYEELLEDFKVKALQEEWMGLFKSLAPSP